LAGLTPGPAGGVDSGRLGGARARKSGVFGNTPRYRATHAAFRENLLF